MVATVVVLDLVFLFVAFGARTLIQRRHTGDTGWRLGRPHSPAEAAARALMFGAAGLLGCGLVFNSGATAIGWSVAGIGVAVGAVLVVSVAQLQMGASWRIGVDPTERTDLIVTGLYREVRNPIYTGMVVFTVGQAMILPSPWSTAAVLAMAAGVEIQVRAVEEPYLLGIHAHTFQQWAASSGRFLPRVGCLTTTARTAP